LTFAADCVMITHSDTTVKGDTEIGDKGGVNVNELPKDAITMQEAMGLYGHTWTWYKNHVTITYVGPTRKAYVSKSEADTEHAKTQQVTVRRPNDD